MTKLGHRVDRSTHNNGRLIQRYPHNPLLSLPITLLVIISKSIIFSFFKKEEKKRILHLRERS